MSTRKILGDSPAVKELLSLIAEILKEPSFPAEEFEQLKQQQHLHKL